MRYYNHIPVHTTRKLLTVIFAVALTLGGCIAPPASADLELPTVTAEPTATLVSATPLPTRPAYKPGELVDYIAQTGDTLYALSIRFNTTIPEITAANPIIPADATTMPPGMPMKIPIYYQALWGSPYQIIPDSLFINGPATKDFNTAKFISEHPGWLNGYSEGAFDGNNHSAAEIIDYVATNFSVSPRILLALLEYQSHGLSDPQKPETEYYLGYKDYYHRGLYMQMVWAANTLNNYYYSWRLGTLEEFDLQDGRLERLDPWQNSATVALRHYFADLLPADQYAIATEAPGLAQTWRDLYGDPWTNVQAHIPGSLTQPDFILPFEPGKTWAFTGGPHTGWGNGDPLAAIDFAPGAETGGCTPTEQWTTAVADGMIVRTGEGIAVLDLDKDGDERTGWVVFYLHLAADGRAPLYAQLKTGQPIGHPSCEGGTSTGTHVHIARKYNGEWMPADSIVPFTMDGWEVHQGTEEYQGTLTRGPQVITACTCADQYSQLTSGR